MLVLGLTGGMAAGKSTASDLFQRAGVPVFDADACVKALQRPHGRAIAALAQAFPDIVHDGVLHRGKLRELVARDENVLPVLEGIMHPLVRQERQTFLHICRQQNVRFCVLDIPLLWETGADKECDLVVLVHAPLSVRLARIRKRSREGGRMSEAEARQLIARQMSDHERKKRADIVLQTGLSRGHLARQIHALTHRLETGELSSM